MTNLTTYTEAQLQDTKFADLAPIYNQFAAKLGLKEIKKFRDKPTGISRILSTQADYLETITEKLPPQKNPDPKVPTNGAGKKQKHLKEGAKASKSGNGPKRVNRDAKVELELVDEPREGTTEFYIFEAVNKGFDTVGEVISYVCLEYKRPSGQAMEERLVLRRMRKAVNKGLISIEG